MIKRISIDKLKGISREVGVNIDNWSEDNLEALRLFVEDVINT